MTDEFVIPENVEAVLDSETFDVLEFVKGATTPKDEVTIYTDLAGAYDLQKLAEKKAAAEAAEDLIGLADETEYVDEDALDALVAQVEASAITFTLKGLAPAAKDAIRKNLIAKHNFKEGSGLEDNEPFYKEYTETLVAKSILSATSATGKVDAHTWTPEQASALRAAVGETEFGKLDSKVYQVNFNTEVFDQLVSADFLSKR